MIKHICGNPITALLLSAVSGLMIILSIPPFGAWPLGFVALVPLLTVLLHNDRKRLFFYCLPLGLLWSFVVHAWIRSAAGAAMGTSLTILFGLYYAWMIAFGMLLTQRLPRWISWLALPVTFTALEGLPRLIPILKMVPMGLLADTLGTMPFASGVLRVAGSAGLTFIVMSVNTGVAFFLHHWLREKKFDSSAMAAVGTGLLLLVIGMMDPIDELTEILANWLMWCSVVLLAAGIVHRLVVEKRFALHLILPSLVIGGVYVFFYVTFVPNYNEAYIQEHKGNVTIEIPEVYELANIVTVLCEEDMQVPWAVSKEGAYYRRMMEHFRSFKNHSLLVALRSDIGGFSGYTGFRNNAFSYRFENDSIVSSDVHSSVDIPNHFPKHLAQLEDFAQVSDFRLFYQGNRSYYKTLVEQYQQSIPVERMWKWLEREFPIRHHSFRIILSPLVGGTHNTISLEGKGFSESLMFVPVWTSAGEESSPGVQNAMAERAVFTEIDHNYVNPVTNHFLVLVNAAFSDLDKWNDQGGYPSAYLTFNEYMTWAVFLLYAHDYYQASDFEEIKRQVTDMMVENRKFVKFALFADTLLKLYVNRKSGGRVVHLFDDILSWASKQSPTTPLYGST